MIVSSRGDVHKCYQRAYFVLLTLHSAHLVVIIQCSVFSRQTPVGLGKILMSF